MAIHSDRSPISFQDELPDAVDAVIIGGGVIGVSTAWFLVKRGLRVLVCEKGRVAGEQSSRNWGWIRKQCRDPDELPIVIDSQNIWEGLAGELGEDLGFVRRGVAYLAETERQLAGHAEWLDVAQQHQLDTRLLSGSEVDQLIDGPPGQYVGALHTPSDARAEPFVAVAALARGVQRQGGRIIESCAVRGIELEAGRVAGVITERGPVRASAAVCAGGAWTSLLLRHMGINLPQLTVRATVARTASAPDVYAGNAAAPDVAFRRRQDGGYTLASANVNEYLIGLDSFRHFLKFLPSLAASLRYVRLRFGGMLGRMVPQSWQDDGESPFERVRVLNPAPSQAALKQIRVRVNARLPALADCPIEEAWAGMIDVTPDVVPVMDEAPGLPGLFIATGFSGHGFGIGPGAGRVMAAMVLGRTPAHDLTRFRFSRFSDGSAMRPGPGL